MKTVCWIRKMGRVVILRPKKGESQDLKVIPLEVFAGVNLSYLSSSCYQRMPILEMTSALPNTLNSKTWEIKLWAGIFIKWNFYWKYKQTQNNDLRAFYYSWRIKKECQLFYFFLSFWCLCSVPAILEIWGFFFLLLISFVELGFRR